MNKSCSAGKTWSGSLRTEQVFSMWSAIDSVAQICIRLGKQDPACQINNSSIYQNRVTVFLHFQQVEFNCNPSTAQSGSGNGAEPFGSGAAGRPHESVAAVSDSSASTTSSNTSVDRTQQNGKTSTSIDQPQSLSISVGVWTSHIPRFEF